MSLLMPNKTDRVRKKLVTIDVRFASFNASLNRNNAGELIDNLSTPNDEQAQAVAEIIQRTNPDVVLINEFDFDTEGTAARLFQDNYLTISQNGAEPVEYPFVYLAPLIPALPLTLTLIIMVRLAQKSVHLTMPMMLMALAFSWSVWYGAVLSISPC